MDAENKIVVSVREAVKLIRFNNPKKKNAIDKTMYRSVTDILNQTAVDNEISMVVLTGTDGFYSSGNNFSTSDMVDVNTLKDYVKAFIKFPKLLIAIVNGPAIGIAATTLALCDYVFASESAYFYTPFTKLYITAEGGSTLTFPKILGQRKAAEMLLFNHKMTAKEALKCGFVNRVYTSEELESKAWTKIMQFSQLPASSILVTKNLLRRNDYVDLLKTNEVEMEVLKSIINQRSSKL
ncbi:enoyl-CoA delta isomerase 2 [Battus philenor]|uniref:enoyl-CoA delta isomerase 2 n=1 Tax=Battus philenor TaxID=42288 RepID=UPI0035CF65BE